MQNGDNLTTSLQKYVMQKTGGINLSTDALRELGWERGKTFVDLYIDLKRMALIIIESGSTIALTKEQLKDVFPLFRSATIGVYGFLTVDKEIRQRLSWEIGGEFRQTLDKNLKGILITKVEDSGVTEDPLANKVKLSELEATKEEEDE